MKMATRIMTALPSRPLPVTPAMQVRAGACEPAKCELSQQMTKIVLGDKEDDGESGNANGNCDEGGR
jgi:hypothetical protein